MPQPTKAMLRLCNQGYEDAIRYLIKKDYIKCCKVHAFPFHPATWEHCEWCEMVKSEAVNAKLPEEIREVFQEIIDKEKANEGSLSSYIFRLPVSVWQIIFKL